MRKLIALGALLLLGASYADAGILKFGYRHVAKPGAHAGKKVVKGGAKVVKGTAKIAFKTAI